MIRIVAALLLLTLPAYSAGGAGGQQNEDECPAGKVRDKKSGKCVDTQLGTDLRAKNAYGVIPPGFYTYCNAFPEECLPVEPSVLTSDWMPVLERVNREVNASIRYKGEGKWDEDVWTVSPAEGDCDDYTVTKRHELIKAGVPRGAMRVAYVHRADGKDHVFLIVSTVLGDYVLDNDTDEIYEINRAMLIRFSIQDDANPQRWWQIY